MKGTGTEMPDEPPIHHNCRCVIVPALEGMRDDPSQKALSYEDWFNRQDEAVKLDILGPSRYREYLFEGKAVTRFAKNGRIMTLKELGIERETRTKLFKEIIEIEEMNNVNNDNFATESDELRERLRKHRDRIYDKMTDVQKMGLENYSDAKLDYGYVKINETLFNDWKGDLVTDNKIKTLDSIFDNAIIQENIITYKGTEAKWYKNWNVGEIKEYKAFLSTSISKKIVEEDFLNYTDEMFIEILVPKGTNGFYLGDKSECNWEEELLLNRGMKFKVLEKTAHYMKLLIV